jgi:hypothetical protein
VIGRSIFKWQQYFGVVYLGKVDTYSVGRITLSSVKPEPFCRKTELVVKGPSQMNALFYEMAACSGVSDYR